MRRLGVTRSVLVAGAVAVTALLVFGVGSALANDFQVLVGKGCASTTYIGDPYQCHSNLKNADVAGDNYIIQSISDKVNSSGGAVTQDLFANHTPLVFHQNSGSGPVTCTNPAAGSGTGSSNADPFIPTASTTCTLPGDTGGGQNGASINVGNPNFSHYNVLAGDYTANLTHTLSDQITYNITDACNISTSGCDPSIVNPENAQGTTTVAKRGSQASTTILSAGGQPVTTVEVGSIVHDSGSVVENTIPAPIVPGPVPTGSVSIDFFNNGGCSGSPASSGSAGLDASGNFNATGFPQGPLAVGHYSFQATYTGDGTYNASPAADCEPLTVVDANIQITPANATNPLNTLHTLTGHVNVNDGNGFANAPDGTLISFAILSGPGSFVGGVSTCTTSGGTGSCTVQITSGVAGTTVIRDSTTVSVGGISLSRSSGDGKTGDSADAQKVWINPDANIQITPATAVNAIGTNHTLTGHVNVAVDGTTFTNAPDGTLISFSILSGPGTFVGGVNTCTTSGGTGSCTVQITSSTVGTTVVRDSTTVTVSGVPLTRSSGDGHAGDSADAQKNWVDANIAITPATAENPVGTNHVLTITINALGGTIDAGSHTATASIVSGPGSFVGSPSCTYTGGAATATCTVTITSSTAGTTVISATSDIPVSGQTITRTTGTAVNTSSGGSDNATKVWGDDTVSTTVRDAANNDVTGQTLPAGTVVHDTANVAKTAGTPASVPDPTGTVDFTLYDNASCNGNVIAGGSQAGVALVGGTATETATFTTPAAGGDFSYRAVYSGDTNYPSRQGPCEVFHVQTPQFAPALTPGFWKNHQAATTALLPITLGNYNVNTFVKAKAIFDAMKCSAPIDCLAGHLLAAKLDLKSGSNPSIQPTIDQADALLVAVNYGGPGINTANATQRALALQLEVLIDNYTNQ